CRRAPCDSGCYCRAVPFRDRPITCPRCRLDLMRIDARDDWRCARCGGALLGTRTLVAELLAVAPDLRGGSSLHDVHTIGRHAAELLPCGVCGADMEAVFLGAVEVDRCRDDAVLWLDAGELDAILERAAEQRATREAGIVQRLLAFLHA